MQDRNFSTTKKPKAGDGTQQEPATRDANWYGQSQEPQEEFIENDPRPEGPNVSGAQPATSEGAPTFHGIEDPRDFGSSVGPLDGRGDNVGAGVPQNPRDR